MNNKLITIKYANIPVIKHYRNFNASINQVIIALILAIIYFKQYHPINYVQNIDIIIILTPITWQNHAYPNLLHCSLSISDFQSHSVLINIGYSPRVIILAQQESNTRGPHISTPVVLDP